MAAGHVDRTVLESNYQQPGQTYLDTKTEGAFETIAQAVDDNYDYTLGLVDGTLLTNLNAVNLADTATGDGTTNDYTALNNLLTTIGATEKTIIISKPFRIGTNITIPSNVSLWFLKGGSLKPDSLITVTINGPVEAGLYQIFTGDGTIAGNMKVEKLYLPWWGSISDGVTDCYGAIEAALTCIASGDCNTLCIPGGTHFFSQSVTISTTVHFIGDKMDTTVLQFNDTDGFITDGRIDRLQFSRMTISGGLTNGGLDKIGVYLKSYSSYFKVEDVQIKNFGLWGWKQEGGLDFKLSGVEFVNNGKNATVTTMCGSMWVGYETASQVSTTGIFERIYCRSGGYFGLYMDKGVHNKFDDFIVEFHTKAMYLNGVGQAIFINYYEESNSEATGKRTHLFDSLAIFILARTSQTIFHEWLNVATSERQEVVITRNDITARFANFNQVLLTFNTNMNQLVSGAMAYGRSGKFLEVHDGTNPVALQPITGGTTAQRPTGTARRTYMDYYDATLNKKIVFDGTNWRDYAGTVV